MGKNFFALFAAFASLRLCVFASLRLCVFAFPIPLEQNSSLFKTRTGRGRVARLAFAAPVNDGLCKNAAHDFLSAFRGARGLTHRSHESLSRSRTRREPDIAAFYQSSREAKNRRIFSSISTIRSTGTPGARRPSRRRAASTSRSSSRSATRPATGATSWRTRASRIPRSRSS